MRKKTRTAFIFILVFSIIYTDQKDKNNARIKQIENQIKQNNQKINKNSGEINKAKKEGRRIIAVGTTTVRTLESSNDENGVVSGSGETDIFIYGDYKFKIIDALITNFHLPCSTLLMLISAFAWKNNIDKAYIHAVENKYRFFSFWDAMFIK